VKGCRPLPPLLPSLPPSLPPATTTTTAAGALHTALRAAASSLPPSPSLPLLLSFPPSAGGMRRGAVVEICSCRSEGGREGEWVCGCVQ